MFNSNANFENVDYIVFDDCSIDAIPHYKNWLGCQETVCYRVKYGKDKEIHWGKPAIWCCNENADPRRSSARHVDTTWLEGNCIFITVDRPLWEAPPSSPSTLPESNPTLYSQTSTAVEVITSHQPIVDSWDDLQDLDLSDF